MTSFQQALRTGSLAALRSIPKSDLHNHAYAGGNRQWVARATGRDIAALDRPLNSMAEMHAWVDRQLSSVFAGPDGRLTAFEATLVQARCDGITRLEADEDVWAITLFDRDAAHLTSRLSEIHARVAPDIEWMPSPSKISSRCTAPVMRLLADNRIRLNICPTSNVMLGRVPSLAQHPIRKLFDSGVIVTVNTDDVLVFGQGVSEEFLGLYQARLFNVDELERIRLAGLTDPVR